MRKEKNQHAEYISTVKQDRHCLLFGILSSKVPTQMVDQYFEPIHEGKATASTKFTLFPFHATMSSVDPQLYSSIPWEE